MYKKFTILIIAALALASCGGEKQQTAIEQPIPEPEKVIEDKTLVISSFSELPDEIEGCSCLFSADSLAKNSYLFASKYGSGTPISYIKVNGKMLRLTESEHTDTDSTSTFAIYKTDGIEVELDIKHGVKTGEESVKENGTITIKKEDGQTITKSIYGACGC